MTPDRRAVVAGTLVGLAAAPALAATSSGAPPMYGLIGKMTAKPGHRDALVAAMLDSTGEMPGCLSYVVALDPKDADAIWITEVWDNPQSHMDSLKLPQVQAAITKARPLIAGMEQVANTLPIGGVGLGL
jgi:quinol monooxygenase YgiN